MKERLVLIREKAGLSQSKFAEKINVSRNFISLVENGNRELSDRTIKDICSTFDINEEWLKTGNGSMNIEKSRNQQLAEFLNDVNADIAKIKEKCDITASKSPDLQTADED